MSDHMSGKPTIAEKDTSRQAVAQRLFLMCAVRMLYDRCPGAFEGALCMLLGGGLQGLQLPAQFVQRLPAPLQLRQPLLPGKHALQGGACAASS